MTREPWIAQPELSDESVREATGHGWDEWRDLIDSWPGHNDGHGAIVSYLQNEHGIDSWWAQSVTVGYERITGIRLRYQQPDGTFQANKSRTVTVNAEALRRRLLDDSARAGLFPGYDTELRSRPTAKSLLVAIGPGTALFSIDPRSGGKAKVTVTHDRLTTSEDVEEWKAYWTAWLQSIDEG